MVYQFFKIFKPKSLASTSEIFRIILVIYLTKNRGRGILYKKGP